MPTSGKPQGDFDFKSMSIFGVTAAAVLSITLQPMIAIADPVALLIVGLLLTLLAFGFAGEVARGLTTAEGTFFGWIALFAGVSMLCTAGDAWFEQRSVNTICAKLQHIMLFEHRRRSDVPEIFRALGCKIQG